MDPDDTFPPPEAPPTIPAPPPDVDDDPGYRTLIQLEPEAWGAFVELAGLDVED